MATAKIEWKYEFRNSHEPNGKVTHFKGGMPLTREAALDELRRVAKRWVAGTEFRLVEITTVISDEPDVMAPDENI